jgi:hypothetical protein
MGIRFYCPNGHKLNVKEFQAGRRGICPFCGARTQIPTQSTRPSGKGRGRSAGLAAAQTSEHDDGQGSDSSPDILPGEPPALPGDPAGASMLGSNVAAGPIAAPPAAQNNGSGPRSNGTVGTVPAQGTTSAAVAALSARTQAVKPATTASNGPVAGPAPVIARGPALTTSPAPGPAVPPGAAPERRQVAAKEPPDPIAEAPEMIWYIRPPSGGQFGPAPGDLMRSWMSEGRVSADSLVWREGWRDWQEAGTVFPKLRGNELSELLASVPAAQPASAPAAQAPRPKPHKSSDNTWIVLLTLTVLLLVAVIFVFLYVLFKS